MANISLVNVCKTYKNGYSAVKDFNLEIRDKDFIIFVGPSGCGKSTTLRMIAGLEEISSGELWIDDCLMNMVEPKNRELSMVFQNYALYPHMSVYENMAFSLRVRKLPKEEIDRRVREAAGTLEISHLLDRRPAALSGGQRQRVAIGSVIVRQPKVYLMDEPLSNLDAKLRIEMRSEIKRLHQELGTTIIYVTHDQTEALTMSTKIAIFFEGVLEQVAPPMELYQNPASLRVADFIGNPKVNFLPGKARVAGDTMTVESVLGTAIYDRKSFTGEAPGDGSFEAVVGVRPELVEILDGPAEGSIEAEVYSVMPAGSETTIYLEVGGERILSKQNGLKQYSPDQKVWLRINPDKMNVFCKDSGRLAKLAVMDAQQDQQNSIK